MECVKFSEKEKAAIFDKIAENYFNRNFGSMSKADFETLLFSEYIEQCISKDLAFDDYTLSKQLGITQSRIRSLKERKELKYPHKGDYWKQAFASSIINAKYDKDAKRVKVIIQDVNVLIEVRNFLEQNGWYDEYQLNRKLLQVSLECFIDICFKLKEENSNLFDDETKDKIKELGSKESDKNIIKDFLCDFSRDGLKKLAIKGSSELLKSVLKCIPFGGFAKEAVDAFTNLLDK